MIYYSILRIFSQRMPLLSSCQKLDGALVIDKRDRHNTTRPSQVIARTQRPLERDWIFRM